jgi:anthranilate synthase/aminodeoxychorismate synthase-like glutamine amidotransferase
MIVVLDNRDSFVFNLARYFHLLGTPTVVLSSHAVGVADLLRLAPQALVISPGPCTPTEAGCSLAAISALRGRVPILGVCLGHQAIAAALGGRILRAAEPVHGRSSPIHHNGCNLFAGIPSPMIACRYHTLVVDPEGLPEELCVTARDEAGTIMALENAAERIYGVQFHPESILTPYGFHLLANFLDAAGIPRRHQLPDPASGEGASRPETDGRVVTF